VAGWERAKIAFSSTALHRALRADVTLRFVTVARVESSAMGEETVALSFPAHPGLYEVVREEGEPEGAGGVVLIDLTEVPDGDDARFLANWERVRELLAARQGCLGTRLHRSLGPADFRFVTIVRWSSPLMYARTLQQPEIAEALAAVSFPSHGALYLPIQS
jgi:heme-degrading monooxygenase HmoA